MVVSTEGTKHMFVGHEQSEDKVTTQLQLISSFAYLKYLGKARKN